MPTNSSEPFPNPGKLDYEKNRGLEVGNVIAVCVDAKTERTLMVGVMNQEAYQQTLAKGLVTFWSRTTEKLWTKGETSGNFLEVVNIVADCDKDTLKISVNPMGPICHRGTETCF